MIEFLQHQFATDEQQKPWLSHAGCQTQQSQLSRFVEVEPPVITVVVFRSNDADDDDDGATAIAADDYYYYYK